MSQNQAAKKLGCSDTQVRRFIARGVLHAYPQQTGPWGTIVWLDVAEVEALDKSWERTRRKKRTVDVERGRIARIAYRYFNQGDFDHRKIVAEHGIDPTLLRDLYREWLVSLPAYVRAEAVEKLCAQEERRWREHDARRELELKQRELLLNNAKKAPA